MRTPAGRAAERVYEQVLALRCQAGDEGAFIELVEHYHARLASYVRGLLGTTDEAEDVLQDVWLAVYRKLPTLRSPRALTPWLYRIARSAAMAEVRGRPDWQELIDGPALASPEADDPVVREEDAGRLLAAMEKLPPGQREVVTLRVAEDMSYEEIAAVVGCPVGTVRSRLHYARESLERELRG